ncbi:ABC transporter substrate-binding protein [Gordonia sp. HY285]|uniref:ABC transporter substrate-binding protein n=1 Tax=Gordonia liuliyuniae TaxID=2911517 RepID=UPI001F46F3E0|nr:ABC transporter substrate-binding protein [Gordonia liuliyuniae]MCF8611370.1 ABC transporter substrate-binding protein [Gordonia liuliyuniae]
MRSLRSSGAAMFALLTVLVLAVAGCSSADDSAESDGGERVVPTINGDVAIPADPQRVVVLNYALAGYLFDLDVPVVATTTESTDEKGEFAEQWADDAKEQGTVLLPWSVDGFDMEAILEQDPDLIVAGGIGFPFKHATTAYDELSKIAPTVVVGDDLTEWQTQYEFIADRVVGKPEVYQDAVAEYDARVGEVKNNITVPDGDSVFLSMLADGRAYVLIEDRGLPKEFAKVGFRPAPLFATGKYQPYTKDGDSFELSTEQVGQVLTQPTLFAAGFNADVTSIDQMRKQPIWAALPSFQKNQAYDLPYWTQRSDYDEAMKTLDIIEAKFGKK